MDTDSHAKRITILTAARRHIKTLVICLVMVPALALAYSLHQPREYSATATLLFENSQFAQGLFGTSATFTPTQQTDPTRAAATNVSLVQQDIIANRTAAAMGQGITASAVRRAVNAAAQGQSDLVTVTATTRSPRLSASMANTYANQFIAYRRSAESGQIVAAENQIAQKLAQLRGQARNTPAAAELATRQQDLGIFASLQTGNAQLSQPAEVPTTASAPRPVRNLAIGILAGLLLGIAISLLSERLDQRVRDGDEIEEIFSRPLLGAIPFDKEIAEHGNLPLHLGSIQAETFRLLRTNLRYFNIDSDIRSVVINSALAGEGKTTVALNLAALSAGATRRVLLIEADMRRPVLASWLGLRGPGLSDVLAGQLKFSRAIQTVQLDSDLSTSGASDSPPLALDILTAGPPPPNPGDLIESARMEQIIRTARAEYDLVIIDTPPTVVSDAIHLYPHVDGVIAVARIGTSRRDRSREFANQLERLRAPFLGVVLNNAKQVRGAGGYGYGYGYAYAYERRGGLQLTPDPTAPGPAQNGPTPAAPGEPTRVEK